MTAFVWPATIIMVSMIGGGVFLIASGHQADLAATVPTVTTGIAFLANLWAVHSSRRSTERRVDEVARKVEDTPTVVDLSNVAQSVGRLEGKIDRATNSH